MPEKLVRRFSAQLRAARKARNMSTKELAERLGKSVQAVTAWQDGSSFPKPKNLEKLANVLQRPVSWFFRECGEDEEHLQTALDRLEQIGKDALELHRELDMLLKRHSESPD